MAIRLYYLDKNPTLYVKLYYKVEGSDKLHYLGHLTRDLKIPENLMTKILKVKQAVESKYAISGATAAEHRATDIYDKQGRVRSLRIYGCRWKLTVHNITICKKVEAFTLDSDVAYFATRIALSVNMELDSIAFLILTSTIKSMFNDWKAQGKTK
ncbi:MAG: hypothetical protein ACRC6V_03970 [Bacteroidales bacterium]